MDFVFHADYINYLISKHNFKSYLEIGVGYGHNYDNIICKYKECCDISNEHYEPMYLMSSDEMFARMPLDKKYDIIFIDGMHSAEYLYRDIINSLKHLNENGLILCHDVIPHALVDTLELNCCEELGCGWCGDCWKVVEQLQRNNIEFYTIIKKIPKSQKSK